jgi:signal peptidase II
MRWLWLAAVVVVLDQWTKALSVAHLELHQPLPVLPSFNLTLMYNTGAAFSFLNDAGGWQRWLFIALAMAVSGVIVIWLRRAATEGLWLPIALSLVLGGALGNLWDRITLGHVVDFIQVYYARWYFPAFNVADSAITVGALMLLIDAFRHRPPGGGADRPSG